MPAGYPEIATTAAKEIFLKMMDNNNLILFEPVTGSPFKGVDLANHLGDCYKSLYKKVYEALME